MREWRYLQISEATKSHCFSTLANGKPQITLDNYRNHLNLKYHKFNNKVIVIQDSNQIFFKEKVTAQN